MTTSKKAAFSEAVTAILAPYKERIETAILEVANRFGDKTALREACEYALQTGGKRFRPALVFMVADALGNNFDVSGAAVSVELFHTASLIADDLPCMDNDDMRRGRPTTHKAFGEATALLASFALIAAGFEEISRNSLECPLLSQPATYYASRLNGIHALIGGQYLDLYEKKLDEAKMYEIIEKKTVSLFQLSFILGFLFGGGDSARIPEVEKTAFHFGAAFQILDDIDDMQKDREAGRAANYALLFGKEAAIQAIRMHVAEFQKGLKALQIESKALLKLAEGMNIMALACD